MDQPVTIVAEDLLEREEQLARLASLAARASAGAGVVVLVRGPAGAGKTRLVQEACRRAAAGGFGVLRARGGQLEREFAFGVVRQLFDPALERTTAEDRDRAFGGAAALAAPVLGDATSAPHIAPLEASYAVHHGLFWLTVNLASERPLVLLVDDAQWADGPSLRWLAYLARRLEGLPVVLALALRSGEAGAAHAMLEALADEASPEVIEPPALSESAITVLLRNRLRHEPDGAFVAACSAATGGNPFLLCELVASLAADRVVPTASQAGRIRAAGPRAVRESVLRRLGRLGAAAEALAQAVAVLGTDVELRSAAALAGLDRGRAAGAADQLAAAGVLSPGRPIDFVHPIVRHAVYESLPAAARAESHRRAARMLADEAASTGEIAGHLLRCAPAGDQWVVAKLREAADAALRRGAADVAVTLLRRAEREPPRGPARTTVLDDLGRAELIGGDRGDAMAAAIEHLRRARAASDDPPDRVRMTLNLAVALWGAERTAEAVAVLLEEAERVESRDRDLALRVEAHLVSTGWLDSTTSPAVAGRLKRFEPLLGRTNPERLAAGARAFEALAHGAPSATVHQYAAIALTEPTAADADELAPPPWPLVALTCIDRFRLATDTCDAAIADATARGALRTLIILTGWRTAIGLRRGALHDAETDARHAFELAAGRGFALDLPATRAFLVEILIEQGRLDEAAETVAGARQSEAVAPHLAWNWFRHARGRLRLACGDAAGALSDQLACGTWMAAWGSPSPTILPWRSAAALAHLALGRPDAAQALAEDEVSDARAIGAPRAIGRALRIAGLAHGGDHGRALLTEAVEVLLGGRRRAPARDRDAGAQLELAHALVDLGGAQRRSGLRRSAREHLAGGMDLAHGCGAAALAERAREELLATGARPRRPALTGRDALTPSERRVAERAAAGLTNREIAQELFVTPRTVEVHLTHVFAKLDLRSRTQLASALGSDRHPGGSPGASPGSARTG